MVARCMFEIVPRGGHIKTDPTQPKPNPNQTPNQSQTPNQHPINPHPDPHAQGRAGGPYPMVGRRQLRSYIICAACDDRRRQRQRSKAFVFPTALHKMKPLLMHRARFRNRNTGSEASKENQGHGCCWAHCFCCHLGFVSFVP